MVIITKTRTMATRYGVQFETLMAEVCRDFGTKLIKSWDPKAPKDEMREFVEEAVRNFFKAAEKSEPEEVEVEKKNRGGKKKVATPESESGEVEVEKKKRGGKKKVATPEPEVEVEEDSAPKKGKGKGKGKAVTKAKAGPKGKPKCQAVTAKGTPCSKCAVESGPFCAVHLKSKVVEDEKPEPKKRGGKKKIEEKEVCEKAGEEIEMPVPRSPEMEMEEYMSESEQDDMADEDYRLEEEDFDEID